MTRRLKPPPFIRHSLFCSLPPPPLSAVRRGSSIMDGAMESEGASPRAVGTGQSNTSVLWLSLSRPPPNHPIAFWFESVFLFFYFFPKSLNRLKNNRGARGAYCSSCPRAAASGRARPQPIGRSCRRTDGTSPLASTLLLCLRHSCRFRLARCRALFVKYDTRACGSIGLKGIEVRSHRQI